MSSIKNEIKETQEQIKQLEKRICELKTEVQQNGWISHNTRCYFKMVDSRVSIVIMIESGVHVVNLEGREMLLPLIHAGEKNEEEFVPIKGSAVYEIAAKAVKESVAINGVFTSEMNDACAKCQNF